jgi:putative phosphoribosyl transferase
MFANRRSAGRQLFARLQHLREEKPVVLALPSGGVPVGFDAPLDIVLVRKIGVPWQPELALGAVVNGADPQTIINRSLAAELAIEEGYITSETARQLREIERRRKVYLGDRPSVPLAGRTVIVVDDGIATGSTARTRTPWTSCKRRLTRSFASAPRARFSPLEPITRNLGNSSMRM